LEKEIATFFVKNIRRETLGKIQHDYLTIKAKTSQLTDDHEKRKLLKVIYENFYKAYNPKEADRLDIVYTPNEIIKFMIESADYLLHKHFDKCLEDKAKEILAPTVETGMYVCDIEKKRLRTNISTKSM
jgi:predicted helicase